ncbi:DUF3788 family protein [Gaoshiqia sp. Z1-71]|uniref:DUF3788 family protein n=1 Tax=Gaoshiqia hydrogeniformans TaxID=3290090 RepID=UPI003BF85602
MDKPLLNDENEYPDDPILTQYLDQNKVVWDEFNAMVSLLFPSMTFEWRYYRDGKAWLCKLIHKKKTICWISIWDKFFKLTFYFTEKTGSELANLEIDPVLKEDFAHAPTFGKLKPLTLEMKHAEMLDSAKILIDYKSKLK